MNYKELFQRLFALILSPKKAWVEISTESPRRDVMGSFVYPLIALCGLAVLFGKLLYTGMERMTFLFTQQPPAPAFPRPGIQLFVRCNGHMRLLRGTLWWILPRSLAA